MFKVIKRKPIFLAMFFLFCFATPIYAIYRIVIPDLLLNKVVDNLPEGLNLSVGGARSKINLEVVYEDVKVNLKGHHLEIPKFSIKPVFNLWSPVSFLAEELSFSNDILEIKAKNIESSVLLADFDISKLQIKGKFEQMNSLEDAIISHGDFIIAGLSSPSKKLDLKAETIELISKTPNGILNVKLNDNQHSFNFDTSISGKIFSNRARVNYSSFSEEAQAQEFSGLSVEVDFFLTEGLNASNWLLPIELTSKNLVHNGIPLFESVHAKAKGKWTGQREPGCNLGLLLYGNEQCGRMTDVHDLDILLVNDSEAIRFYGNGNCVAPNSGCRQTIRSHLQSKNTQQVFLRLLEADSLNPVILSVLMGMLLRSPSTVLGYEHGIDIKVDGSEILLNNTPLF